MSLFKLNIKKMKAKKDVEGLIKALDYKKDYDVISDAILALGELRDKRAVEPLISCMKKGFSSYPASSTFPLGMCAQSALIKIGEPAVEPLIEVLKNEVPNTRASAAYILGEIGDKRAVEPLFHALGDSNLLVEGRAAEALEVIGEPAVEYLFKALEDDRTEHVALVTLRNMRARGQLGKETLKKLKKLDYIII